MLDMAKSYNPVIPFLSIVIGLVYIQEGHGSGTPVTYAAFLNFMTTGDVCRTNLCLGVYSGREVGFCVRNPPTASPIAPLKCPSHRIMSLFQRTGVNSLKIRMIGGLGWNYIALVISNVYEEVMLSGSPLFICALNVGGAEAGAPNNINFVHGHLGTGPGSAGQPLNFPPQRKVDPTVVQSVDSMSITDGLIHCEFTLAGSTLRTFDGKVLDLLANGVHVTFAQGYSTSVLLSNAAVTPQIWRAEVRQHNAENRHKSRFKFNLMNNMGGDLSGPYKYCGLDHFCFGFGADGCMSIEFNCMLFLQVTQLTTETKFLLSRDQSTAGQIGVGFSRTRSLNKVNRLASLKYFAKCFESGTIIYYDVSCSGESCSGSQSSGSGQLVSPTVRAGNGRLVCEFTCRHSQFSYLGSESLTLLLLGTTDSSTSLTLDLTEKVYGTGGTFGPSHINFGSPTITREDFIIAKTMSNSGTESIDLNPTEKNSAKEAATVKRAIIVFVPCIQLISYLLVI